MIISANKNNIDHVVYDVLKGVDSPIPIVVVTRTEDFEFNDELLNLDRYVIADYTEYGWNAPMKSTHIYGQNTYSDEYAHLFIGEQWQKLHNFFRDRRCALYFKREILEKDVRDWLKPIDYPAFNQVPEIETKEQFESRPIEVFYNWGLSNPSRPKLQGDIWHGMNKYGYALCDNLSTLGKFFEHEKGRKWVSVNTQWHSRFKVEDIININGLSKLSVSLFGSGRKCFRMTEASLNSVMVLPEDNFAAAYEWIDGFNCIKFQTDDWVQELNTYATSDIYSIYKRGVENCRNYELKNYIKNYIEPNIKINA
jgi:hypothetical protein